MLKTEVLPFKEQVERAQAETVDNMKQILRERVELQITRARFINGLASSLITSSHSESKSSSISKFVDLSPGRFADTHILIT